jgi:hypothetical protein
LFGTEGLPPIRVIQLRPWNVVDTVFELCLGCYSHLKENQSFKFYQNNLIQAVKEANNFKSFKKWFDISPRRVTFKAEKQPGNDFGERFGNRSNEATYFLGGFFIPSG